MNLGPATAPELRAVGIGSLEELQEMGWEEAFERVCERFPDRAHGMMAQALIGAVEGINCLALPAEAKARANAKARALRRVHDTQVRRR